MRNSAFFTRVRSAPSDFASYAVLAALVLVALFTFRDYGIGWDDPLHMQYGKLLYSYYASGLKDIRAFSYSNLFYYGGGFDIAATFLDKHLPFDPYDTRRLWGAIVGILGMVGVWRLARRLGGPLAGLAALLLIATNPTYYGHMFINAKDTPFATAMIFLVLALVRAFDEYPKPKPLTIFLFALTLGLTIGTRIIGGVAAGFFAVAILFAFAGEWRQMGLQPATRRAAVFCGWLMLGLPLSYAVMGLIWPYSVQAFDNPLRAIEYFSHFWEHPWKEMYDGVPTSIINMPRSYLPKLCFLKYPEIFIGLSVAGVAGAIIASVRGLVPPARRAGLMLVVSAGILPILLAVITKPVLYNGTRHFLFVAPALAVMGGLAADYLYRNLAAYRPAFATGAAAVFALLIVWTASEFVRIHPYEYTLFNNIAGNMQTASQRYMTDYWGLGIKETSHELVEWLDEHHESPPPGRKWRVVVCGPGEVAEIELGKRFVTTFDMKGADFAISLGTFYCAHLDAPVLADSEREGVAFARAYDLRGRNYVTTWSFPPEPPKKSDVATAEHKATTFWH
jgi:hypothetical protein